MYAKVANMSYNDMSIPVERPSRRKVLFILGELSDRDLDWMIATGHKKEVPAGTVLIQEGIANEALYIVLNGTLSVCMAALAGREISTIGCGEVLGEMSFVDDRPPSATVKAIEDSVVLAIPREPLAEKLQQDVLFALRFYRAITKFLSTRLRGAVTWLSDDKDLQLPPDARAERTDAPTVDEMAIASARFDQLLQRLQER